MIIDASMLLKCPKCSSVKKVRGLISGNLLVVCIGRILKENILCYQESLLYKNV